MKKINKSDLDFYKAQINNNPIHSAEFKKEFSDFLDGIADGSKGKKDILKYILGGKALIELFDDYLKCIYENFNSG